MHKVEVRLLGRFEVRVDGAAVPAEAWTHGRARDLVKLLALAPDQRLPREVVVDDLWPRLDPAAGLANLHKAAHHARRAIGDTGAVVLREGQVRLAPHAMVETDVAGFEASSDPALYTGELLPEDRYAPWLAVRRTQLRARFLDALRAAGRWEELAAEDPGDEAAQREVMRGRLASGDRAGAQRAFQRLQESLDELGLAASLETRALYARIAGGGALGAALAAVEQELARAPVAERAQLLATRADLLLEMGDRAAPAAYAEAAAAAGPEGMALRIRQAWAQLAGGDPAAAQATLAPLAPRSPGEQVARLVAQAAAAWFGGDVEGARRAGAEAQPLALSEGLAGEARSAIMVQAMAAHSTGAWPDELRRDLRASLRSPGLADTLFDGHLCIGEFALTSGDPFEDLRALAQELHAGALRSGARRVQVFAASMLGRLALFEGRLQEAGARLREAVAVSSEISAVSAEALARARLGEVVHVQGRADEADALFADALVLASWSPISGHLKPLTHAAQLRATSDPDLGRERLDTAEARLRGERVCAYCGQDFRVTAAVTAARAGQPDRAAAFLGAAEAAAGLWQGGPWPAALEEARGEVAQAREQPAAAREHLQKAAALFAEIGRPLDAERVTARAATLA